MTDEATAAVAPRRPALSAPRLVDGLVGTFFDEEDAEASRGIPVPRSALRADSAG